MQKKNIFTVSLQHVQIPLRPSELVSLQFNQTHGWLLSRKKIVGINNLPNYKIRMLSTWRCEKYFTRDVHSAQINKPHKPRRMFGRISFSYHPVGYLFKDF